MFDKLFKLASSGKSSNSNFSEELKRINQEMYERNVELAIRNRTFSVLNKLYDIINTSLTVQPTAQKLIEEIVRELKFKKGFIALADRGRQNLKAIAVSSSSEEESKILDLFGNPFRNFTIPLTEDDNHCVIVLKQNKTHLTNFLQDVLAHYLDERKAIALQEQLNIQTCILYPISFAGKAFGVMMLSMDKHVGELSRAEREIMKELIEVVSIAIERSQIFEDLQNANTKLKELDKLKDEFVYIASHELRTPMTAIKNYLWMAINKHGGNLSKEMNIDLSRAYESAERLIRLVQDMLTVSRIEGKRLLFEFKKTKLNEIAKKIVEELKLSAADKKLTLLFVPSPENFEVWVDPTRISEIFMNLIGNSLKFTPAGGTITISIRKQDSMIETSISDTGIGIPKEDITRLFQKFGRLGHSYKRLQGESGTGLGLYISKQIVTSHGGKIWVASTEEQGSTFTFSLPLYYEGIEKIYHNMGEAPSMPPALPNP